MLLIFVFAVILVLATTLVHGMFLAPAIAWIEQRQLGKALTLLLVVQLIVVVHVVEAAFYGVGFAYGARLGLGGFKETDAMSWMDYLYFSVVNYTTLGLGDIYPTGHLRFLAGVEAVNGFLMISCSAAFVHKLMTVKK